MTAWRLILRSALYHWRTNVAVVAGVATAVAVLAGALVVGDSVRASLRELALGRLGRTASVLTLPAFARDTLVADLAQQGVPAAPMIAATGVVTHEPSGRRAANVHVYGVDERFWAFHGTEVEDGVYASPALARELGARGGDVLLARIQRPSEIPLESVFGRRDEVGRTVRLTLSRELPADRLGEFVLQPQQDEVRSVFVPLRRVQRDLGVAGEANTFLLGKEIANTAVLGTLSIEDLGVRVRYLEPARAIAVESASGILNEALQQAALQTARSSGGRRRLCSRTSPTRSASAIARSRTRS